MIWVVVPAHNEEKVIGRCLRSMLQGASPGEIEIIVVCNGCKDRTAAEARGVGGPVRVLETEVASKSHALNMGDREAAGFPRFYVDADVEVSIESLRKVARRLETTSCLVAAPRMKLDLEARSWPVRAYYEIWTRLPYIKEGLIGSGVYALSERGRAKFESFPNIISDDGFIRLLFPPEERATVEDAQFEVTPPRDFLSLIRIKTRSQFGKYQLLKAYPHLRTNERRDYRASYRSILGQCRLWPCIPVYCLVLYVARLRSFVRSLAGRCGVWDRDESSRSLSRTP